MYITREAFVERTLIISSANQKIKKIKNNNNKKKAKQRAGQARAEGDKQGQEGLGSSFVALLSSATLMHWRKKRWLHVADPLLLS